MAAVRLQSRFATPSHLTSVGLAFAGYTCWVLSDACLKRAGSSPLPAYELLAFVGAGEVLLLLLYAVLTGTLRQLWPRQPGRQLLRSCLDLVNNLCVVIALRHLPLELFYILVFLAPLATASLAALLLREMPGWKQTGALLVGFGGVVIAVDPRHVSRPEGWTGYIACLACVTCFSVNMVWARRLTQTERPHSLVFTSGLVMLIAGILGSLHRAAMPTVGLTGTLAVTSVLSVVGSVCFFVALKHITAATVSQFHYSQLVTGALVAYVGWRELPTPFMLAGAVLILASGAYAARLPAQTSPAQRRSILSER